MTDERCKELMKQVGLPNSRSLMTILFQLANETEQRMMINHEKIIAEKDNRIVDLNKTLAEKDKEIAWLETKVHALKYKKGE